jgi:hypothetical protein
MTSTAQGQLVPQHTPGPWDCDGCTTMYAAPSESDAIVMIEVRANVSECGWDTVAFVEAIWPGSPANACLIVAAPELLQECHVNAKVIMQAADLLRELGYDDMAIALLVRSEITSEAIARATAGQPDRRPA